MGNHTSTDYSIGIHTNWEIACSVRPEVPGFIKMTEARWAANILYVDLKVIPLSQLRKGMMVELEHGSKLDPRFNLTNDSIIRTAQIALAHLAERLDYYDLLEEMEKTPVSSKKKVLNPADIFIKNYH